MKNKPNYAKFIKKPTPLSMSAPEQDAQPAPIARRSVEAEELPFAEVILTARQRSLLGEDQAIPDAPEASTLAGYAFADPQSETPAHADQAGAEKRQEASKFTNMIQSLHSKAVTEGAPPIAPMVVFVVLLIAFMSI